MARRGQREVRKPGAARPHEADIGVAFGVEAEDAGVQPALRERIARGPQLIHAVARSTQLDMHRWGLIQIGLQPGDLVKEVNGVVLDNALRGAEIMQALNTQTQLSMRILRGAEEVNLMVDIPQ